MPKSSAKARKKAQPRKGRVTRAHRGSKPTTGAETRRSNRNGNSRQNEQEYRYVVDNGRTTHVLVPVEEYEKLIMSNMVSRAVAQIESGDDDFVNADDLALELAAERIAKARKARGMTQKQLGDKLKLPQSQISRIERNPDRTTVRTLKRIARALGVDVSALI